MDSFFLNITWFGSLYLLIPLGGFIGIYLTATQRSIDAVLLLAGLLGASLITHLLKLLFGRPRPPVSDLLVTMPADFSFPSAHTSQATAFACACALIFSRQLPAKSAILLWLALLTLVALVGISRTYLKVHYVSDVLAGALLGAVWIFGLKRLLQLLAAKGGI